MIKPHCSNLRIIAAIIFRSLTSSDFYNNLQLWRHWFAIISVSFGGIGLPLYLYLLEALVCHYVCIFWRHWFAILPASLGGISLPFCLHLLDTLVCHSVCIFWRH